MVPKGAFMFSKGAGKLCFHFSSIPGIKKNFASHFFDEPLIIQQQSIQSPCFCICSLVSPFVNF
jgi:hypothetical protein